MAKTDFKYSDQDFFRSVAPDYGKYLARTHLKNFVVDSGDKWKMGSVGTKPSMVYFDGVEGTSVANSGAVSSAKDFYYDTGEDILYIYVATASDDPNDDEVIEIGEDKDTFIDQQLVNASMMLNSLITSVVTPIPKTFVYNDTEGTETPEYDYFIKRAECLLAFSNMANAEGDYEVADRMYEMVANIDKTGIVDRINDGSIKLAFERESADVKGRIIRGSVAGTMELTELSGNWTGSRYERLKIECTVTGGYGVSKFKVWSSNSDKLYGTESGEQFITGNMQSMGGMYGRFEGNSATDGDIWYIEVKNDEPTNASSGSIELWR